MSQLLSAIPLTSLTGVGAKVAEKLAKVGLNSVQDLLFHLPLRYEDRTRIYPIVKLHVGLWAAVQGKVMSVDTLFGKRKMLSVKISDGNGTITLRFFQRAIKVLALVLCNKCLFHFGYTTLITVKVGT